MRLELRFLSDFDEKLFCYMTCCCGAIIVANKNQEERQFMKMKKRISGIILSLALFIGLMPVISLTAYADEDDTKA